MSGYVLIHRDLIGNPQFRSKDDEYAAIWLVVMAAWEPTVVRAGRDRVNLQRGQCAYAVSYLAQAWGCSKSAAYGRLKHFEAVGFITAQADRDYTLITIQKYDEYQSGDAFGYRSGSVHPERNDERQPNDMQNAESRTNAQVYGDEQTPSERSPVVQPERCPNAARTNKKEGKELINKPSSLRSDERDEAAPDDEGDDLKARIFGPALDWLAKQSDKSRDKVRPIVGKWCRDYGDGATLTALQNASRASPVDPVSWIQNYLTRENGNGKTSETNSSERQDRLAKLLARCQERFGPSVDSTGENADSVLSSV